MTTTHSHIDQPAAPDASNGPPAEHRPWQAIAVVGSFATVLALYATSHIDLCTTTGTNVMRLAWLILPVTTIAATIVVAGTTAARWERWTAGVLAAVLTTAWVIALIWANVAMAFDHPIC